MVLRVAARGDARKRLVYKIQPNFKAAFRLYCAPNIREKLQRCLFVVFVNYYLVAASSQLKWIDMVRRQLVRGNPEVRTSPCIGKLRLTDDWQ